MKLSTPQKTGAAFVAALALAALLYVVQADDVSSWKIPPWKTGDRISYGTLVFDPTTGEVTERRSSEWLLHGPFERRDGDGVLRSVYRWERVDNAEVRGYAHYSVDLERGISMERLWPPLLGREYINYDPGKHSSLGLEMQGRSWKPDGKLVVPLGFLNGTRTFSVTSMTDDRLVIESLSIDELGMPYESADSVHSDLPARAILEYEPGNPYPTTATGFSPYRNPLDSDDTRWVKVSQVKTTARFSGAADGVPTNHGPPERFLMRDADRVSPGASADFLGAGVDPRFPPSELLPMMEADQGLQGFLRQRDAAVLVDVANIRLYGEGNAAGEETIVWNLTWADPDTNEWYSFARAKTIPAQDELLGAIGLGPQVAINESFATWRTMAYTVNIPWHGIPSSPQIAADEALDIFAERGPIDEQPVLMRWGPLSTDANYKPVHGTINYMSRAPTWAFSVGTLSYFWADDGTAAQASRSLDTMWILGNSGTVAMTPFEEPYPPPG